MDILGIIVLMWFLVGVLPMWLHSGNYGDEPGALSDCGRLFEPLHDVLLRCPGPGVARKQQAARPHGKDMIMDTLAMVGIALTIALITLGVVVFAYKASPPQSAKR